MEELWSLTSFFGYSTQTFVQAVNLFDRFLAIMKVGHLTVHFVVSSYGLHVCMHFVIAQSMRLTLFDF